MAESSTSAVAAKPPSHNTAVAAAAYAANPVLPDMTARFVPQKVTQKKGLCWRCGQLWSLRKDGTIRDHS